MTEYVVLVKSTREVRNADGSVRYQPGDPLPPNHPDIAMHLGDGIAPTAFEVVDGGLRDTDRAQTFVADETVLGPRATYGERPGPLHCTVGSVYLPPPPKAEPKKEKPVPAAEETPAHKPATLSDGGTGAEAKPEAGPSSSPKGRHS